MKNCNILVALIGLLCLPLCTPEAKAQSDDVSKFELGVHFTSITKPDNDNAATQAGFGGRFTFNFNRSVALEAVGNFFPNSCRFCGNGPVAGDNSGTSAQGLFGVKAGRRFEKWGIFAKARTGVVSFSEGDSRYVQTGGGGAFPFEFQQKRLNNLAFDLGGVLEFYPSKRLVTRFEAGDTLIHYGARQTSFLSFDPTIGALFLVPFTTRPDTRHNFQFTAGVGWRF
jgi:hypothetical protein